MKNEVDILERLYALFNQRDIDAVLAQLDEAVVWANGMEGGHVVGHQAVREYWTRQWSIIDPCVEPVAYHHQDGSVHVEVLQNVRTLDGDQIEGQTNRLVGHVFHFRNGKISRFDIR